MDSTDYVAAPGNPEREVQIFASFQVPFSEETRIFTVRTKLSETVENFKNHLALKSRVYPAMQRLIFKGKMLQDHMTLEHSGIQKEDTLILNLPAGCLRK